MGQLLLDLINLLSTEMPELVTVDEDYGQMEMINREHRSTYPLLFPTVLIDAPDNGWSNNGGLSQKGNATDRAHLIIDCYDDTHAGSGTTGSSRGAAKCAPRSTDCCMAAAWTMTPLSSGRTLSPSIPTRRSQSRFHASASVLSRTSMQRSMVDHPFFGFLPVRIRFFR